jgi:hypothetical protein
LAWFTACAADAADVADVAVAGDCAAIAPPLAARPAQTHAQINVQIVAVSARGAVLENRIPNMPRR